MYKIITKKVFTVLAIIIAVTVCGLLIAFSHTTANAEQTKQKSNTNASVQTAAELEDLGFSLINDGAEYSVRVVNKQVTEVNIPTEYDGKPVTEIATNGFMSCRKLTSVYIPSTVKAIGTNAFYGCTVLERVWGGASLTSIANNAFANCTKLQYFRIPKTIETLGNTIFRNNPNDIYVRMHEEDMLSLSSVSSTWSNGRAAGSEIIYGSEQICIPVDENDLSKGYILMYPSEDMVLNYGVEYELMCSCIVNNDGTEQKYPIVGIDAYVFEGQEFESLTVKYDPDIDSGFTVSLGDGVFASTVCKSIKIEVNIEFYDLMAQQDSIGHFMSSEAIEIVLPDNIEAIPNSCFADCEKLTSFVIPSNVKYIDDLAFQYCLSIERIDIPASVSGMGYAVFTDWGQGIEQTISFEAVKPPKNDWDTDIKLDNVQVLYKTVTVVLDSYGGTGGTESVQAMYGRPLPEAEVPQPPSEYVTFGGYYSDFDGMGDMYYDSEMKPTNIWGDKEIGDEDNAGITTLYALWTGLPFTVRFEFDGGEGDCDDVVVRYGELFPDLTAKQAPEKSGYEFTGYYTEGEGNGIMIYDAAMKAADVKYGDPSLKTLYAAWKQIKYKVSFDLDGGTSGTSHVFIAYMTTDVYSPDGQAVPNIEVPVKQHYTFQGFYMNGVQYFSADGKCVHKWDMEEDTLTAVWNAVVYPIIYEESNINTFVSIDDILQSEEGYIYSEKITEVKDGRKYTWAPIKLDINNFYCAKITPTSVVATLDECYDGTSGTYKIWYLSQLDGIRDHVNSMTNTVINSYELMADIEIAKPEFGYGELESWIPLPWFAGSFNGRSHTISGLCINTKATVAGYYGLFFSNSGTISRLNVKGSIVLSGAGEVYAGLLCGRNTGRIENCRISSDDEYGIVCDIATSYVGGAVGYNSGTLYYVYSTAGISGCGNIGGVVGRNVGGKDTSFITGSTYSGNILYNCTVNTSVGGIAGVMEGGTIGVCATAGMITVKGASVSGTILTPCIGSVIGTLYSANTVYGTQMAQMGIDTLSAKIVKTYVGGEIGRTISSLGI